MDAAASISARIQKQGGLESYQQASMLGQSASRGGDSSKVLLDWLEPLFSDRSLHDKPFRILEVGALSVENAVSTSQHLDVTRIDLNSQHPGIKKQDFMTMQPPTEDIDRYDAISLSLVLNYVPDPAGRGEMLKRTCQFLRARQMELFPALFLVLPAPCIDNSRYLDEARLTSLMMCLGYSQSHSKVSSKLFYSLWHFNPNGTALTEFKKKEINSGRTRNNFAIVLK